MQQTNEWFALIRHASGTRRNDPTTHMAGQDSLLSFGLSATVFIRVVPNANQLF